MDLEDQRKELRLGDDLLRDLFRATGPSPIATFQPTEDIGGHEAFEDLS
jgi:hypothetical protein